MTSANEPDARTRILEAALALLAEHGVAELSQPKVAKAAGVRQGHLTYYFPTRADLLKAIALYSIGSMLTALTSRAAEGSLTADTLAQVIGDMVSDKRRARTMLGLVVASDEDREIKQFLRDFVGQVRAGISGLAHMLGTSPDPQRVAAFHALMVGTAILNVARDDANSKKDCSQLAGFAFENVLFGGEAHTRRAAPHRKK